MLPSSYENRNQKFNKVPLQKYTHRDTQYKWDKPNPSKTVCLSNRQSCSSSTIVPGERKNGKGRHGTDEKRHQTSNARRNGKPVGQMGASGEQRATKRENGMGRVETSGGWRTTKQENATDVTETSSE